ncbi:MAG: hypothetical protein K6B43_07925 [Treponema sp.]|nr:hypothetical protein [Treponema sp.]
MATLTNKYEGSAYTHNTGNIENRAPNQWSKRKIVADDDLNKLQSLIVSGNVDLKVETQFEISNCACQGACMSNCVNSCEGNCVGDCESGCKAACMQNCVNNLS